MACPYHKRESVTISGKVTLTKVYNPPFHRTAFKSINIVWFNKIEVNGTDGIHYTLYDFQEKGKPETRTLLPDGFPKKGQQVVLSYYPLAKPKRGCIKVLEIL